MSGPKYNLSGTENGKAKASSEKSKFVQTCNRLSLFLKEKGNLRDLSFAKFDPNGPVSLESSHVITPGPAEEAMTYDLLNNMEYKKVSKEEKMEKQPLNVLPQYIILDGEPEDSTNKASSSKPKTAQMTIFYNGKVVVLDDVTEDKARRLMIEASGKIEKPVELASTSKVEMKDSDLPIARRASLNKFLAKRKERAIVRAPYQVHNLNMSPGPSSSGNEHSFDLNM